MTAVHKFGSTGEAYDACQCDDGIEDGDVLVIEKEGVVGVADTWPVAVTAKSGALHGLGSTPEAWAADRNKPALLTGFRFAEEIAQRMKLCLAINPDGSLNPDDPIKVHIRTVDGIDKTISCATLDDARKAARNAAGEHPDLGTGYAVSADGVVTVRVDGCTLADLFPEGVS
jgi:hypothetical protein